jgi:FAD/FMN-containing dehydrogenase
LTASIGGGAYLKVLDEALKPYNLGVTIGTYPLTGVGGLTLAGGYGWLARKYGLSVDNLLEAEVVLSDGEVVIVNDSNQYSDLMWGLRGGGGNFGIVTKFVFRVHILADNAIGGFVTVLTPTKASAIQTFKKFDQLVQNVLFLLYIFSNIIILINNHF